jgi:hypothetical protein
VPCSIIFKKKSLRAYPSLVVSSEQSRDLVRWSRDVDCGVVWLRQKHDYVVLWRRESQRQVVLFRPARETSVRFAQKLLRALEGQDFVFGECCEREHQCKCGDLVEHLFIRWMNKSEHLDSVFEE